MQETNLKRFKMQKTISFDKKIYELRKIISILQWDMPNIQNDNLRGIKEKQLMKYKNELQELLKKNIII